MTELWNTYWPVILVAIAIGLITGFLIFRPKQRVTLTRDSAPIRPHMAAASSVPVQPLTAPSMPAPAPAPLSRPPARDDSDGGDEGEDVGDEIAAAASDVVGEFIGADVHSHLPESQGVPDDLQRMKGVGPKLAGLLSSQGYTRYEQIAALTPEELDRLDAQLGAFRGRLARDRVVEQAAFLARGDEVGYERVFGRL